MTIGLKARRELDKYKNPSRIERLGFFVMQSVFPHFLRKFHHNSRNYAHICIPWRHSLRNYQQKQLAKNGKNYEFQNVETILLTIP